jgi:hypothetical protein
MIHDEKGNRLVFGGLSGKIGYLDLNDGSSGILLDIPGRPAIVNLALARDGSALACVCRANIFSGPTLLQIWNYPALHGK